MAGISSPHPRGCFFLIHRLSDLAAALPRTRGGVSDSGEEFEDEESSSPHPRGCFLFSYHADSPAELFPAPAGVFLYQH